MSNDKENTDIIRSQLEELLIWDIVDEIPLLVFGNKIDLPGCFKVEGRNYWSFGIEDRKVGCY